MKVLRWSELDELESTGKIVDEFYTRTNIGPILTALLFPIDAKQDLQDLKSRIEQKKAELRVLESEIYTIRHRYTRSK